MPGPFGPPIPPELSKSGMITAGGPLAIGLPAPPAGVSWRLNYVWAQITNVGGAAIQFYAIQVFDGATKVREWELIVQAHDQAQLEFSDLQLVIQPAATLAVQFNAAIVAGVEVQNLMIKADAV